LGTASQALTRDRWRFGVEVHQEGQPAVIEFDAEPFDVV
jgi:hypothetical protein